MIDPNKKYRTRDGREVRIYATDGEDAFSIHGAICDASKWHIEEWREDGCYHDDGKEHFNDLIEVKPEVTVRVNVGLSLQRGQLITSVESQSPFGGPLAGQIGAIDITHDGDRIIKVEIVNDYVPGAMR